jgi:hypothetical protein
MTLSAIFLFNFGNVTTVQNQQKRYLMCTEQALNMNLYLTYIEGGHGLAHRVLKAQTPSPCNFRVSRNVKASLRETRKLRGEVY